MQLSKFIKTTGLALSFATSASIYADKQIVELWWDDSIEEVNQKVTELREDHKAFKYFIHDVDTLVWFLENYTDFIDGDCKMTEGCLLNLLKEKNSEFRENVKAISLDAIKSEKIREFVCALQTIISEKENNQQYLSTPDWNKIVAYYGIWATNDGIVFVESEAEDAEFKKKISSDFKFAAMVKKQALRDFGRCRSETASGVPSRRQSPGVDDDEDYNYREVIPADLAKESFVDPSEIDPVACRSSIGDVLKRLSEAGKTDNVCSILYDQESYEAELREMLSNHSEYVKMQSERRDRSQSSSTVPSHSGSPESQE